MSKLITKNDLKAIFDEMLPIDSFIVDTASTSSFTVSASNVVETTLNVAKSGYTAFGILGYNITGSGVSYLAPYHLYLNSDTVYYAFRNYNTGQVTNTVITFSILYRKV